MNNKATVTVNSKRAEVPLGTLLSALIENDTPCGGHGRCGKCKVYAGGALSAYSEIEEKTLSEAERRAGIRLACQTKILGDAEIIFGKAEGHEQIELRGALPKHQLSPIFRRYGLAVDLGTTTIAARLYDKDGKLLCENGIPNPQGKYGADVISRIENAIGGKQKELSSLAAEGICSLAELISKKAGIGCEEIDALVITGNTVMLSLLAEEDMTPFSRAPFSPKRLFGEQVLAKDLSLSCFLDTTPVYLPPCFSAFVGADTATACLAVRLAEKESAMLCDVGTNGEIALSRHGKITVCSTAAGPAFEGVGISCGMRSIRGAVDRATVKDGGLSFETIEDAPAVGICGSGLITLAASLLSLEILDESGFLAHAPYTLAEGVSLTQGDVRALQLAKSAIGAGMMTLLDAKRLSASDLTVLYLAGGFGSALDPSAAAAIGLLPSAAAKATSVVGNAALSGASLVLLSGGEKDALSSLVASSEHLELSGNRAFAKYYTEGMILSAI